LKTAPKRWLVDPAGSVTYASSSNRRILGYKSADLIGRKLFDLHPEDQPAAR
jgi:PAS domain S-box-containing protein